MMIKPNIITEYKSKMYVSQHLGKVESVVVKSLLRLS